jgi:outer membrane protein insertion porin family
LRATVLHDTRDEPVLPSRGVHLFAAAEASPTPLGSDYPYVKIQARFSQWHALPWGHVMRFEGFAGAIFGTAPLFEKFYVGDLSDLLPDRALELNFDRRSAPNFLGTSIVENRYGEYAARLQTEYRIPLYRGRRSIYGVDIFGAAGIYALAKDRDLIQPPRGYSPVGAVPLDITFNLGVRIDTSAGGLTFGISNFLGFLPVRKESQ